jgi:hypothetical protein
MKDTWTYEDIVIAMIHQDWKNGDQVGLSAWDIRRRLRGVEFEASVERIISALHLLADEGKLTIVDGKTVPFRYCITEEGVTAGGIACTKMLRLGRRRAELPPP